MKIGIDISQMAHEGTGVGQFVEKLVTNLIKIDNENTFILFGSSLRKRNHLSQKIKRFNYLNAQAEYVLKLFPFPPTFLDFLWNKLHILPIESFIGEVDVFISSDWVEPPTKKAKKITILYDLIIYKYPKETSSKIISVQKRKLNWVKKECQKILCISQATKKDAMHLLGIEEKRLEVIYPGV